MFRVFFVVKYIVNFQIECEILIVIEIGVEKRVWCHLMLEMSIVVKKKKKFAISTLFNRLSVWDDEKISRKNAWIFVKQNTLKHVLIAISAS